MSSVASVCLVAVFATLHNQNILIFGSMNILAGPLFFMELTEG